MHWIWIPTNVSNLSEDPFVVLKQMKYDGGIVSDPVRGIYGAGPHTDWGSFTVLANMDPTIRGLQVLLEGTEHWIDVPPIPNTFIINAGDQISILTKSKYKSALHRVLIQEPSQEEQPSATLQPKRYVRYTTAVFGYFGINSKFHPSMMKEQEVVDETMTASPSSNNNAHQQHQQQQQLQQQRDMMMTTKEYFHYKLHQSVGVVTTTTTTSTAGENN